jgi:hypothetical protein
VVVAFSDVDETIERSVHAQAHWPVEHLHFGSCFVDILEDQPSGAGSGPLSRVNPLGRPTSLLPDSHQACTPVARGVPTPERIRRS